MKLIKTVWKVVIYTWKISVLVKSDKFSNLRKPTALGETQNSGDDLSENQLKLPQDEENSLEFM